MTTLTKKEMKEFEKSLKSVPRKTYEDLQFYKLLRDELKIQFKNSDKVDITECRMGHQTDYLLYTNNSTCIDFGPAYLRFGSRAKSIDISRVDVEVDYQGKGLGTVVMDIFMTSMYLTIRKMKDISTIPDIILECSGSVGYGDTKKETPIREQIRFFEKFGFELQRYDKYGYAHMKLCPIKGTEYMKKTIEKLLDKTYVKDLAVSE